MKQPASAVRLSAVPLFDLLRCSPTRMAQVILDKNPRLRTVVNKVCGCHFKWRPCTRLPHPQCDCCKWTSRRSSPHAPACSQWALGRRKHSGRPLYCRWPPLRTSFGCSPRRCWRGRRAARRRCASTVLASDSTMQRCGGHGISRLLPRAVLDVGFVCRKQACRSVHYHAYVCPSSTWYIDRGPPFKIFLS